MAIIKGNVSTLKYKAEPTNDAASVATDLAGYAAFSGITSCGIDVNNSTFQSVNISDPANETVTRNFAVGTTSTSLSIEGVYDPAQTNNAEELFDLCKDKTRVGVFWINEGTDDAALGGIGFCTSFELSAGMDDFVTFSASFELEGNPVYKTAD
jgi:predicted secreted protein